MYETLIVLFMWAVLVTTVVSGIGAIIDVLLIKLKKKAWLQPKWLWNLLEGIIIVLLVSASCKTFTPYPWWQMAPLYASMAFLWSAFHDCWIGVGIADDPWHLGKSRWDRKMFAMFNQFGLPAGLNFFVVKLFWGFLAAAAFFSL